MTHVATFSTSCGIGAWCMFMQQCRGLSSWSEMPLKSSELCQPRIITAISDSLSLLWRHSDFFAKKTGVLLKFARCQTGPVPWRYDNLGFLGELWLGEFCEEFVAMGRGLYSTFMGLAMASQCDKSCCDFQQCLWMLLPCRKSLQ